MSDFFEGIISGVAFYIFANMFLLYLTDEQNAYPNRCFRVWNTYIWNPRIWDAKKKHPLRRKARIIFWMIFRWGKLKMLDYNLSIGMTHESAYNKTVNPDVDSNNKQ